MRHQTASETRVLETGDALGAGSVHVVIGKRASGPIEGVPRWVAEVFRVELAWEEEAGEQ